MDIAVWCMEKTLSEQYGLGNGATPYGDYANPHVYDEWDDNDNMIVGHILRTITDPNSKFIVFTEMQRFGALPDDHFVVANHKNQRNTILFNAKMLLLLPLMLWTLR